MKAHSVSIYERADLMRKAPNQAKMPPVPGDLGESQGFWSWKISPSLRASSRFPYSAAILRAFK
jgi:hypothetical protein